MRIEQRPDGSYVRRLTYIEEQIIKRLYQEVEERRKNEQLLAGRVSKLEEDLTVALQELNNLKMRFDAFQANY